MDATFVCSYDLTPLCTIVRMTQTYIKESKLNNLEL